MVVLYRGNPAVDARFDVIPERGWLLQTCEYEGDPLAEPRSHPWTDATGHPEFRYYDLTREPGQIRTALEDYVPWNGYPAVEKFYALIAAINQADFALESNDCEFTGPDQNETAGMPKRLMCSGRVMVFFRRLEQNIHPAKILALRQRLHIALEEGDRDFRWGIVGTTVVPVRYLSVRGGAVGTQLMISYWAWGDTEAENMDNLGRLFTNLSAALGVESAALR